MSDISYFAYGSNMSLARLRRRIAAASRVTIARLDHHRLAFHKSSEADGSAKCDIAPCADSHVLGVVFRLPQAELATLDAYEGEGYARRTLSVITDQGPLRCQTYQALVTDPRLQPYTWYKHHVLAGAREAGLPEWYIAAIQATPAVSDPDDARARHELSIYGGRDALCSKV